MRARARAAAVLATAATLVLVPALAASAHVTVKGPDAQQGGFSELTFSVPNEQSDAGTVKLEVAMPTDTPLAFVSVKPVPGWSFTENRTALDPPVTTDDGTVTEAVSSITWTASDAAMIKPGEYQTFAVSAGPLPDKDSLTFPAVQTYSNGDVVRWIEDRTPGQAEPEHPAPLLRLAPAGSATPVGAQDKAATADPPASGTEPPAAATAGQPTVSATPAAAAVAAPAADSSDGAARGIAVTALVVGVLGLGAGAAALVTRRRAGGA